MKRTQKVEVHEKHKAVSCVSEVPRLGRNLAAGVLGTSNSVTAKAGMKLMVGSIGQSSLGFRVKHLSALNSVTSAYRPLQLGQAARVNTEGQCHAHSTTPVKKHPGQVRH